MQHEFLHLAVIFLFASVIAVPLSKRLGLGSVLGYLAAGALLGPAGFRVVSDPASILKLAELGVVMLLFVIGLELKPSRLWVMRRSVFGLGTAQVFATSALLAAICRWCGLSWPASTLAGVGLSLSSTPFALQLLSERGQMNTAQGRASFSILLFQDVAVLPLLAIVPLLGTAAAASSTPLTLSIAKPIAVIAAIVAGGRYLVPMLFRVVASSGIKEVFVAMTLLIVVGTATLMETVGLSAALGTFIAGLLLSDSEYRHELEADIDPFKGLLLGLFFMGVGTAVDLNLLVQQPVFVLSATIALMALKSLVLYGIGRATGFSGEAARGMASVLPQGGEFAFVLFNLAAASGVMATDSVGMLVLIITLSMVFTPIALAINDRFFCEKPREVKRAFDAMPETDPAVIIAGIGRVGQIASRVLRHRGIAFTALENNPEQVDVLRRFGNEVYYGDASRLDLLEAAGAKKAKIFVLAIDDMESSLQTAQVVRKHFPHLKILARARNRTHAYELMNLGVMTNYRETLGSSLEMAHDLLVELGTAPTRAQELIDVFRDHDQKMLMEQYQHFQNETELINIARRSSQQLTQILRADEKQK